ncbi:alpha-amylase family glycosyl hydrolase [Simiduia agarivorans]|uniref:Cyclomaltodextrin glucanotransferase n=1 Tax=Simiduia agarivorans (strain DSM 21679 / JCM 13881 / BCRC 17597 / SA1) TaxID=1117647 RepID=K4KYU9_SIMAS|nr:alpha-amylase family glycosyl hydrolase [Simiduia agarivorans]AFU99112.1 cyclomaltodextrin glucanotransferase [Simiduia agarivorans SA1 = DSM 21679]
MKIIRPALLATSIALAACGSKAPSTAAPSTTLPLIGTDEPWASEAIYFVLTDRFVDGDSSNNFEDQGREIGDGRWHSFHRHFDGPNGRSANVGYMGGDFKGLLNHADFITDMGFTAVWMTPIVDNPDAAFNGGDPVGYDQWGDGGKTGFHGYWGVNFYALDEHLPSADLDYRQLNRQLKDTYNLKTVLDIVGNHGSPSYSAPEQISNFGKLFDASGALVADHQNIHPEQLSDDEPLHHFFNRKPDVAQLSDFDENNPAVVDYLVGSYLQWIDQGADAIRIDTIKHVPHHFWKTVTDRIRAEHPGYFLFGESWNYDAEFIAQHTLPENGGVSVLDFPMQQAMFAMFGQEQAPYSKALEAMYLTDGPYHNVYELVTFYDNHDVQRLDASDEGFIDANNFIFTNRGIPQIYYGSEMGFERGMKEHQGSRNYYGVENIEKARKHRIFAELKNIAHVRKTTPALQRGLQHNLAFTQDTAAFYRVLDADGIQQTALVLLNKGDQPQALSVSQGLAQGEWKNALTGETLQVQDKLQQTLAPHSVQVWIKHGAIDAELRQLLN